MVPNLSPAEIAFLYFFGMAAVHDLKYGEVSDYILMPMVTLPLLLPGANIIQFISAAFWFFLLWLFFKNSYVGEPIGEADLLAFVGLAAVTEPKFYISVLLLANIMALIVNAIKKKKEIRFLPFLWVSFIFFYALKFLE